MGKEKEILQAMSQINEKIGSIDKRLDTLDEKIGSLGDRLDEKINSMDERLCKRLDGIDYRLTLVEHELKKIDTVLHYTAQYNNIPS